MIIKTYKNKVMVKTKSSKFHLKKYEVNFFMHVPLFTQAINIDLGSD